MPHPANPELTLDAPGTYVATSCVGELPPDLSVPDFAYLPDDLPPRISREEVLTAVYDELSAATAALNELKGRMGTMADPTLLAAPLAKREAIVSSRIEDTFASGQEIALAELGEVAPADRAKDIQEVLNYYRAIQHAVSSPLPISERLVKELHEILLTNARGEEFRPGRFRTSQNFIVAQRGERRWIKFVPPPHEHIQRLLLNLSEFISPKDESRLPSLAKVAIVHYQFETIHPFNDGNGRIGRLVAALQLRGADETSRPLTYLSGPLEQDREQYNALMLRVSTHGEWIPWLQFFLHVVRRQAIDTIGQVKQLDELKQLFRSRVETKKASASTIKLLDALFESPAMNAKRAVRVLGVTDPAARNQIKKLEAAGILRLVGNRSYNQLWVADEIAAIVDGKRAD